jgi:hypothetical protein
MLFYALLAGFWCFLYAAVPGGGFVLRGGRLLGLAAVGEFDQCRCGYVTVRVV